MNACVKQLLVHFHGGYLWLDELLAVVVELILAIMGLPKDGPDLSQEFGNDFEEALCSRARQEGIPY